MFTYFRKIHVYETDLMGIVHHSNYLRFCEEARVAFFSQNQPAQAKFLQSNQFIDQTIDNVAASDDNLSDVALLSQEKDVYGLVVYETRVCYKRPLRYSDTMQIQIQLKSEKAKLIIQYKISSVLKNQNGVNQVLCALAETVHCRTDENLKVLRLDKNILKRLENEKWIETWL